VDVARAGSICGAGIFKATMKTSSKSAMDRVRNPQGRADWLAANLLREAIKRKNDPALKAAYAVSKGEVEDLLKKVLGPKTTLGRQVKKAIQTGRELMQEMAS